MRLESAPVAAQWFSSTGLAKVAELYRVGLLVLTVLIIGAVI